MAMRRRPAHRGSGRVRQSSVIPVAAHRQASLVLVDLRVGIVGAPRAQGDLEKVLDALPQGTLMAGETQDLVAALGDEVRGAGALAAPGIKGHHGTLAFQHRPQFGNRGEFVGFLLSRFLAQHQAVATRPGADQVQRATPTPAVRRAPRRLAVQRHDLAPRSARHGQCPTAATRPKALGREARNDVRDAVRR